MIFKKFFKAQLSSLCASSIDFLSTIIFVEVFKMWYAYAVVFGMICGGITNCVVNYRWVFHAKGIKKKHIFWRYLLTWFTSVWLNTLGTIFITETTSFNYIIAKVIVSIFIAVCWNYPMQRLFVFKKL